MSQSDDFVVLPATQKKPLVLHQVEELINWLEAKFDEPIDEPIDEEIPKLEDAPESVKEISELVKEVSKPVKETLDDESSEEETSEEETSEEETSEEETSEEETSKPLKEKSRYSSLEETSEPKEVLNPAKLTELAKFEPGTLETEKWVEHVESESTNLPGYETTTDLPDYDEYSKFDLSWDEFPDLVEESSTESDSIEYKLMITAFYTQGDKDIALKMSAKMGHEKAMRKLSKSLEYETNVLDLALKNASWNGHFPCINLLIQGGGNVKFALKILIKNQQVKMLQSLFELHQIDPKTLDLFVTSSITTGNLELCKELIKNGADVCLYVKESSRLGQFEILKDLFDRYASFKQEILDLSLWKSFRERRDDCLNLLVEKGAKFDFALIEASKLRAGCCFKRLMDHYQFEQETLDLALRNSIYQNHGFMIKVLMEKGAKPDLILKEVAKKGNLKFVKELLETYSFKPETLNAVLQIALDQQWSEIIQLVIKKGANIDALLIELIKTDNESTEKLLHDHSFKPETLEMALLDSVNQRNIKVINMLIKKGIHLDQNHGGLIQFLFKNIDFEEHLVNDALKTSIREGCLTCVKLLTNCINDTSHVNLNESLVVASKKGHCEIVTYLLDKGANIHHCKDVPLYMGITQDQCEITKLLLERGADLTQTEYLIKFAINSASLEMVEILLNHVKTSAPQLIQYNQWISLAEESKDAEEMKKLIERILNVKN